MRLRITRDGRAMRAIIADAWTLTAAHAVFSLRLLVAPLLVAPVLGAHAIGVIGMTVAIVETLAGLKAVAWRMSLSLAARLGDQRDRLARAIRQGRDGQVLLLGGLLLGAGLAIETVVPLLFGPRWGEVHRLYPFVALAMLVNAAATPRLALLAMTGHDRMVLFVNAAHIALFATACALLSPRFGLLGYGLAELIALGVYALVAFGPAAAHGGDEGRGFGLVWTVAIGLSLFWRDIGVVGACHAGCRAAGSAGRRPPASSARPSRMTSFLFLRIGPPETDFRFALAEALHALGHEVAYLYLGRRPRRVELGDQPRPRPVTRLAALLWLLARRGRQDVVFNATDLAFTRSLPWLKRWLGGLWVFDLHDDLRYGAGPRVDRALRKRVALHDLTVCAAPSLIELVPGAIPLGNASDLAPSTVPKPPGRILVLASLDPRFDFTALMRAAEAAPRLQFDLYGHVAQPHGENRPKPCSPPSQGHRTSITKARTARPISARSCPAMRSCLRRGGTDHAATRHIDPLRFHHALRAGLELVTTDIPAARLIADRCHIVRTAECVGPIAAALSEATIERRNRDPGSQPNWGDRARQLLALIDGSRCGQ